MKFKDGLQNITIFRQNIKLRGWLANYYILIFTKKYVLSFMSRAFVSFQPSLNTVNSPSQNWDKWKLQIQKTGANPQS